MNWTCTWYWNSTCIPEWHWLCVFGTNKYCCMPFVRLLLFLDFQLLSMQREMLHQHLEKRWWSQLRGNPNYVDRFWKNLAIQFIKYCWPRIVCALLLSRAIKDLCENSGNKFKKINSPRNFPKKKKNNFSSLIGSFKNKTNTKTFSSDKLSSVPFVSSGDHFWPGAF